MKEFHTKGARKFRETVHASPSPGAADEVSVKNKSDSGRGEGERFLQSHFRSSVERPRQPVAACLRNSRGDIPTRFLKTRLKCVSDWKPASKASSLTRTLGSSNDFLARSKRTRERYSLNLMPVTFLNSLQK